MARGGQDFGFPDYTFGAANVDNNEIQQMLLGFGLVDGLGRTMFYDDFHEGLGKWLTFASAAGMDRLLWAFERGGNGMAFRAPHCCEIMATAAAGNWGQISAGIICGQQDSIGLELGLIVYNGVPDYKIFLDFKRNAATAALLMGLLLSEANNTITLFVNGADPVIDTFNFNAADGAQRLQLKMSMDCVTRKYKRLVIAEKEYDVSQYQVENGTTITPGNAVLRQFVYSIGGVNSGYYGYTRVTKDEP